MNRFSNPTLAHFASLTRCLLIVVGGLAARFIYWNGPGVFVA